MALQGRVLLGAGRRSQLPQQAQLAEEDPRSFLLRHPPPLLVDEVQYAPRLFRYLKVEIDNNRDANGQFILTGSQKFILMKEVSDSLAGRCGVLELEGLSIEELGDVFHDREQREGIASMLVRGFMPQLWKDPDLRPADYFSSYQATYLERDVRQLLNVSSLRDFDRFMRASAVRSGQLLNKTELAKEVGVSNKTATEWLSVLEASNQITLLEPWFTNVGKAPYQDPQALLQRHRPAVFPAGPQPGLRLRQLPDRRHLGDVPLRGTPQVSLGDRSRGLHLVLPGPVPGSGFHHRERRPPHPGGRQVEGTPRTKGLPPAAGRPALAAHGAAAGRGAVPNRRELSGGEGHAGGQRVKDAPASLTMLAIVT